MEKCANCGKTIGDLEPAHIFNEHVVCGECRAKLQPPVIAYQAASGSRSKKWLVWMVLVVLVIAVVMAGGLFVARSVPPAVTPAAASVNAIPTYLLADDILNYINAHPEMNDDKLESGLEAMFAGKNMLVMFAVLNKKGAHSEGVKLDFDIEYPTKRVIRGASYAVNGGTVYLQSSQTPQAQALGKGADFGAVGTLTVGICRYDDTRIGIRLYLHDAKFH